MELQVGKEEVRYAEPSKLAAAATAGGGEYEELYEAMSSARAYRNQNTMQFYEPQKVAVATSVAETPIAKEQKSKKPITFTAKIIIFFTVMLIACFVLVFASIILAASTQHNYQLMQKKLDATQDQLSILNSQQTSTQNQLGSLTTSVNDLNSTIHSPIQLHQTCYTEIANSTVGPSDGTYKRRATTAQLAIHVEGYETVEINCHFDSNYYYTVVANMKHSGADILCYCDVFSLSSSEGNAYPLTTSNDFYLDCVLSITRCQLLATV